jgi:Uma2 family endonuclease
MYAMPGGKYNHARVTANLSSALTTALKTTPCAVASSDLRIRVSPDGLYTYADTVVICNEPQFADGENDTLTNPVLICEVLSPSTEAYDRGFKFAQYRTISLLKEYVMVSQFEPHVEVFRRQDNGHWVLSEYAGMDATCYLGSLDCSIPLSDLYDKIIFEGEGIDNTRPSLAQ